jgi:hypothetical protein
MQSISQKKTGGKKMEAFGGLDLIDIIILVAIVYIGTKLFNKLKKR